MTTLNQLMTMLETKGLALTLVGDGLSLRGNESALADRELVASVREHKQALVELLRAGHTIGAGARAAVPPNLIPDAAERITPEMLTLVTLDQPAIDLIVSRVPGGARNVQDIYPLTPLQEGMLFHHLWSPDGDAYTEGYVLAFPSRARMDRFTDALEQVVARHDVLRTSIAWDGLESPVQVVQRRAALPVEILDVDPACSDVARELELRCGAQHLRLDLGRAPLLRCYAAHDVSTGRWLLSVVFHHIAIDHLALELLVAETWAIEQGRGAELPPPAPFRAFVAEARLGVSEQDHAAFFTKLLGDIDETTAPFGLLDEKGDGSAVAEATVQLPRTLASAIRASARRLGVSPASLVHLAWALVAARTTGRKDVVFGTVLFGRMQAGADAGRMLGLLMNTLPLRVSVGDQDAEQAAKAVHALLVDLLRHEHAPLSLAMRASGVAAPAPLFTSLLNYRYNVEAKNSGDRGDGVEVLASHERTNYPLTLSVDDLGHDFALTALVSKRVLPERVCAFMQTALERLVDALEHRTPLRLVDVLPEAERLDVVERWNQTRASASRGCVHEQFEAQVRRNPEAIALVHGAERVSYGALNAAANRLAHHLRGVGVGPEHRVAICLERGVGLVTAILAVLKAGGAYVPLDPAYASERLVATLADSDPSVVLVDATGRGALGEPVSGSARWVDIERDAAQWAEADERDPGVEVSPSHLAYVIYTSGSTGRPKGVMVEHAQVSRLFASTEGWFGFDERDVWSLFHSIGFDFSVWELWGALSYGGRLVVVPLTTARSPAEFYELLCAEGVTVLNQTPSAFQHLMGAQAQTRSVHQLRWVIFGGEALELRTLKPWYERNDEQATRLVNMYGITETTVHVTYRALAARDAERPGPSPIGVKLPDLRLYVLDEQRQPVAVGVTGELYVGGAGVARGYLGQPELTAERFVDDPFTGTGRLYRTGDLGRWLPDGSIEYLGRNDFQVKIRGFRIELGEIEARLAGAPGVAEVVVAAQPVGESAPGERRLVAYYTGEHAPDARALREHAARGLPDYMLPAAYVRLAALPLTPNGKLDRKALPAPDVEDFGRQGYEQPTGSIEQALAGIWAELLQVERVGRRDSFFALGGHSLAAVRLVSRVRKVLGVELALSDVFLLPELAALAEAVSRAARAAHHAIPVAPRSGPQPLSLAQRRLWFLSQLSGASEAYHISGVVGLRGVLARDVLRRALQRIVERHEALRTCFQELDGEPVQVVQDTGLVLDEHDLRGERDPEAATCRLIESNTARAFDLTREIPLRVLLVQRAEHEHVLHVVMHHIASDGWSIGVFVDELTRLYRAFLAGQPDPLPPLAIQYADYAAWQRRWLGHGELEAQATYWREGLQGAPALLELPIDRQRPARQDYAGAAVDLALDAALTARIQAAAQRHGVTPYVLLLSSWAALLGRLSGQTDVVIGSPVAGRNRTEVEPLIGFFVNTLPLRIDLNGGPTVRELVARTRDRVLAGQAHQDLPFDQIVEAVNPPRSLAHPPLFQVMFAWQNTADATLEMPGLELSDLSVAQPTAQLDLTLTLHEGPAGITGDLSYATALFDHETAERIRGQWLTLLEAMLADEEQPVSTLPLLSERERHALLVDWNTMAEVPALDCLHERFEAQVRQRPDAIALAHGTARLTYRALNERANRLAHHLRALGIGADRLVAICVDRGLDMVTALLATLKAGGAYVPLDPAYASARLGATLADCAPAVLLIDAVGREALGAFTPGPTRVIDLDRDAAAWADAPDIDLERGATGVAPNHLAYVIYTSGSTGRPKGVMVEHAQVVRLFDATEAWFHFDDHDVWTLFHSFSFDFSVWEIWGALLYGGRLVIVPAAVARSPRHVVELICDEGVTVLNQTPSAFQQLMAAEAECGRANRLRTIIFGGEALELHTLRPWYARHEHGPRLVNMYGITETTVHVTYRPLEAEDAVRPGPSPIGVRIPDLQLHILDGHRQPVPVGVTGELYVGGAGVARGYLGQPELTAERFLENPFPGGGRLYRTGDLARRLPDGSVEYLGRNDFQVKIRGFRVELGEIEASLSRVEGVRDVVVVAREDEPGDKRLVAYFTASGESAPDAELLRRHAAQSLPPYMVPAAYLHLEALPLTGNGKLDRKALPAPQAGSYARRAYEEPRGRIEVLLADLWSELLKVERVGRRDDFFALGGHSLLAVQLVSRVRRALDIEISLAVVFEYPELARLAERLNEAATSRLPAFLPLTDDERREPQPLSLAQQRLWFLTRLDGASDAYHIGGAVRLRGALDREVLRRSLQRIVERHEALRTTFERIDGQPRQVVRRDAVLPWQERELAAEAYPDREAAALAMCSAHESAAFDLERDLPVRALLVRLSDDDHVLHWVMHHIAADGWSMGILLGELTALYRALARGEADPLPPLAIQYVDHAVWQRRWLAAGELEAQAEFWRRNLAGAPALLELPTDQPRVERSHAGANVDVQLGAALSHRLHALCRRHGVTPYMALLASWAATLGRLANQEDVVIGSPVAGRSRTEIEPLIGFFVNTLALRIDLRGEPTVAQLLARTRAQVLAAQEHQDLPFDQVVEAVKPPRSLAHSPLFQVMFDYLSAQPGGLELPGLQLSSVERPAATARFDLSLTLEEGDAGITGSLVYATALFERATVERIVAHWTTLLEAMAAGDDRRVAELPVLSEAQRRQILVEWNDTAGDYPRARCLHELFEDQARRTPDATALVAGDQSLSFAELDARASRLARSLRARGVGPDVLVAVCAERGIAMVVGFLGVLKAGGAYIPVDPHHPVAWLAEMLEEAAPRVVLTEAAWQARLPAAQAEVVLLAPGGEPVEDVHRSADADELDPRALGLTPRHLAYVMFTSGSTGRPKGVMVEHRGIVNYTAHMIRQQDLASGDGSLVLTSLSFDLALTGLYPPLLCGKTVRLGTPGNDVEAWRRQLLSCSNLAPLKLTPSHLALLQQVIPAEALAGRIRTLVLGGEPLRGAALRWWREHAPAMRIFNNYGPTEISVACTAQEVTDPLPASVPLGRPITNARIYILDARGEPVPVGVAGELHVGGVGVARGYVNRPELTRERFLPDPFAAEPDARMYRTGDVARWRPDGTIEYLGRNDHQVKIRGYRVELGEIEATLRAQDGVDEVVVVAREDAPGDLRLVAYLAGASVSPEALRQHASERLPSYMVPSAFVHLAALPLTANGKVDRAALPAPDGQASTRAYEAPRGEKEERLARIWAELLKLEQVGRNDNFFELGGHSLLAVSLIERMRAERLHADVRAVFLASSLAELAERAGTESQEVTLPDNLVTPGATRITPEMLTLVHLDQEAIDSIVAGVDGGAANVADIYPLAPLQEGMLFHHLLDDSSDAYVESHLLAFPTRAGLDRFVAALDHVIARHDILRTGIAWRGLDQPVQVVRRQAKLPVELVVLDPREGDIATQLAARCDPRRVRLDVSQAPLLRCHIASDEANGRWVMSVLSHHLVVDHTTLDLLVHEAKAFLRGEADRLPPPVPFRTFVAQARLGVSQDEHRAFFAQMLGDIDEPTAPFGLVDVRGDGRGIGEAHELLPAELALAIRREARRLRVSPASLMHLAWAMVLARTTGREQVVFGTVLFGRMQGGAHADRGLGLFMNTLPVRLGVGERGAAESVTATHALLVDLLRHEHAPLALAQRASAVPAEAPLFTSLLNYRYTIEDAAPEAPTAGDASEDRIELLSAEERTNYPLVMSVDDLGEGFALTAHVREPIEPARVCAFMRTAVEAVVRALEHGGGAALRELDVLPAAERAQVVAAWNATARDYRRDLCVHELFEAQARRTPDAIAVIAGEARATYRELDERANRLAHLLRARGVGPDGLVGVAVDRGIDLVVAVLGTLKAGGAYVPLDPSYPRERLATMLADARPSQLVTQTAIAASLPATSAELVLLDAPGALDGYPSGRPERAELTSRHLAYVIYTSGSTGQPKGVMVEHRSIVNFLTTMQDAPGITAEDVLLGVTSLSFDIAALELYLPLSCGATVVIATRDQVGDPAALHALIEAHGVSILQATPSTWRMLAEHSWPARCRSLKVLCGGEALPPSLAAELLGGVPELWNLYGPTETTIWSTLSRLTEPAPHIGRPIANTQVYVLDAQRRPVPIGVPGELYIGGDGVVRGYLHREELTAERFVSDPFTPDGRLYRTGDLVRWLPDGDLEYLGRNDFQVKLRGFRIELGEIEARLAEVDEVREVVVVAREDVPGDARLVAYYTAPASLTDALRQHAAASLPGYMMPAAFVHLSAMPLTANGKVDRKALPAPETSSPVRRHDEAPRGEIEQMLAGLWADLLQVPDVTRRDNFFELGGHSLLAVQMVSRLRRMLDIEVPLAHVFEHPRLSALAERLSNAARSQIDAITPIERGGPLPLSLAQQRLWILDRLAEGRQAHHLHGGIRLRGPLDREALAWALARLVKRHEALRTCFRVIDGEPMQIVRPEAEAELVVVARDLRGRRDLDATTLRLASAHIAARFDLERDLPMRAMLMRVADDEHVLHIVTHHIVSDGWSMGVLLDELSALYNAHRKGAPDPLPALSVQYADYAAWQRRWLERGELENQVEFWRRNLADAPTLLTLPTDRPRPAQQDHGGDTVALRLPVELADQLRALGRRHGVTLYMTILASWAVTLGRLAGQDDVVIGTPVAGRTRAEIEPLIGFFVNTLAMRIDLAGDPTLAQLLARTRAQVLATQRHQDLSFDQVVEVVKPPRSLSHPPIFQVLFAWQNTPAGALALDGLDLASFEVPQSSSQFDLRLSLYETESGIEGTLSYATALFERATAERFAALFERSLRAAVESGADTRPIARLSLLDDAERAQVVTTWNATRAPYPHDRCFHELFEDQVARTPDAAALVWDSGQLSYRELDERANRLARYLRRRGVRAESRVAVCIDRSPDMIVALLATLKAGGAYVPLDPSYPPERLAYMLADSAPQVVVVDSVGKAAVGPRAVIDLSRGGAAWAKEPAGPLDRAEVGIGSRSLAYIIYTSGSTGQPKGVLNEHRGLCNLVTAQSAIFGVNEVSRVLQFAAFSFDASVSEVGMALVCGASLHVVSRDELMPGTALSRTLARHGITHVTLPPSALAQCDLKQFTATTLIVAGEAIALREAQRWSAQVRLFNAYGPTEAAVCATIHRCSSVDGAAVPIGRPIPNARIYLLDSHREPVPVGVIGEIYIGGDGVGRGYLNRPELTQERFLDDPWSDRAGDRMYRTGDLGRWLPDGSVEFLGRNDHQVKIRGFRIEPGEIEAVLAEVEGVGEVLVLAREDQPGDLRLVAYYTAEQPVPVGTLRRRLADRLPEYMIPSAYVHLAGFPLSANGKVDRKALPIPEVEAYVSRAYLPPQGEIEQSVAALWAELLNVDRIGRHDSFFDLGGHSLLAVQMLARLREIVDAEVALRELFAAPTLLELCAVAARRTPLHLRSNLTPFRRAGTKGPVFFIHPGPGEIGYVTALLPGLDPEVPVYGLSAIGYLSGETPLETIEAMAAAYVSAIREVQAHGPYRIVGWCLGGNVGYEMAHQLLSAGERVEFLAFIDAPSSGPIDPSWLATVLNRLPDDIPDELRAKLAELDRAGDVRGMLLTAQAAGFLPVNLPIDVIERYVTVAHAVKTAKLRYVPPPLPITITHYLAAERDPVWTMDGWEKVAQHVVYEEVGGDHMTMVQPPHARALARRISEDMARANAEQLAVEARPLRVEKQSRAHAGPNVSE
ncbi:amino acid adenylation domain-containing protein [Sorangium sp. So ce1182]